MMMNDDDYGYGDNCRVEKANIVNSIRHRDVNMRIEGIIVTS